MYPPPTSAADRTYYARLAADNGFVPVDLYPSFQAYLRVHGLHTIADIGVSRSDPHPNAEGHRLIAEALLPAVQRALDLAFDKRVAPRTP